MCRQYTFFRPYSVPELKFRHENFPRLPPIPSEPQVRGHQVCAAIACDIDLTLINHTLLIQARGVSGAPWPAGLPGLPPNMLIAKDVKKYSDRLYEWVKAHADKLKLAGWYESGTRKEIKEAKWGVTDLKVPVMAALDHVHKHKAIIAGPAVCYYCNTQYVLEQPKTFSEASLKATVFLHLIPCYVHLCVGMAGILLCSADRCTRYYHAQ